MKKIFLFFIIITSVFVFSSEKSIQEKDFFFRGRKGRIGVIPGTAGTNIFIDTGTKKIITELIPGENLCPEIVSDGEGYFATWINYKKNDVALGFYNSVTDNSEIIARGEFSFISSRTSVVLKNGKPEFIFFRAIRNSDNEDIFLIRPGDKRLLKITNTSGNEKMILVQDRIKSSDKVLKLETKTLNRYYIYEIDLDNLEVRKILDKEIEREIKRSWTNNINEKSLNTIVAFGDSITWGKMRMNDLQGEYHPELTYWYKASEYLTDNYGKTYTLNLGVPADTSQKGVDRMDTDFSSISGYYLLVMFGTNDVGSSLFSVQSTTENLEWILNNAKNNYGMYPIISTIPPQKKYIPGVQLFKDETEELNTSIISMAVNDGYAYIDPYPLFMNYPDGWEALLEDVKGNHPNPAGHQIIADLAVPKILELAPAQTEVIEVTGYKNSISVTTKENFEFDFDHYEIRFGYIPGKLEFDASFSLNTFSLIKFPLGFDLRDTIYFMVRSVDKDGNSSSFTGQYSAKFSEQ